MSLSNNDVVEIETAQLRVLARVRNVQGERIYVAIERGGYLPWTDTLVLIRAATGTSPGVEARIVHASGSTALLELLPGPATAEGSAPQLDARDKATDEG